MTSANYVLVRPLGGLNDNLTQLERCWRYAERFCRTLLVDTAGSEGFHQAFSSVFEVVRSACPVACASTTDLDALFASVTVLPHSLQGLKQDYPTDYNKSIRNFVHAESGERLGFDFGRDHPETLLVHQQCGGQRVAIYAMARLRFTSEMRALVADRLRPLAGKHYLAVHVRHTDYQTDYNAFFDASEEIILSYERCLLCTDSREVADYARQRFGEARILQLGPVPDTGGAPLHRHAKELDDASRKDHLVRQFADLLGLAMGSQIVGGKLTSGGLAGFSGFFMLADGLRRNSWVISQLLGRSGIGPAKIAL